MKPHGMFIGLMSGISMLSGPALAATSRPLPPAILASLPADTHERVICSIAAAVKYEIPVNLMLAVAEQEGGKPGMRNRNRDATHDIGAMQFNTKYLGDLTKQYGILPEHVAGPGCYPYELAAWRIRMHIKRDKGDIWKRAANYHSRTEIHNLAYQAKIIPKAARWATWLSKRFRTVEMGSK